LAGKSPRQHPSAGARVIRLLQGVLALGLFSSAAAAHATETAKTTHGPESLPDALEQGGHGDGVYGRFDAYWALSVGAGFEAAPAAGVVRPVGLSTLRFYQSVGLSVAFAQAVAESDPLERSLSPTLLIEPLFLLRWSKDDEWGRAFWDLAFDSLSLSVGAVIAETRGGTFGDAAGFRLGLGAGLPLLAKAGGPWLRLGGRMDTGVAADIVGSFWANLEWQWFLPSSASD
jgi:hypothetical protein